MKKRVCPHCKQEFSPDRFHPEQVVCSFPPCQRQRRSEYHRRKIAADPAYRDSCANGRPYWKEKNPDYTPDRDYQFIETNRELRLMHPKVVEDTIHATTGRRRLLTAKLGLPDPSIVY